MATVEEIVHTAIDQDVILQGAIARGIVNRRAVARWLEQNRSIEADIESIYDAVEAYEPDEDGWRSRTAWEALEDRAPQRFKPVTALTLKRTRKAFRQLSGLFTSDGLSYQTDFRILPSEGLLTIIVEDREAQSAVEIVGAENVFEEQSDLVQVEILPGSSTMPAEEGGEDGWVLASVAMALASAGIEIPYAANGRSGHYLVIPEDQDTKACRLLQQLLIDPAAEELDESAD